MAKMAEFETYAPKEAVPKTPIFMSEIEGLKERVRCREDGLEIAMVKSATAKDILNLCRERKVNRSAHIGNMAPANLVCGALGAKFILYDRNTPAKDFNYLPGHLLVDGKKILIGKKELFEAFTPFTPFENEAKRVFNGFASPAQMHLLKAETVFPSQVQTQSEYFNANRELFEKVIYYLGKSFLFPSLFDRSFDRKGVGFIKHFSYDPDLSKDFFETNQAFIDAARKGPEGARIPSRPVVGSLLFITLCDILEGATKAYQEYGEKEIGMVYHLAGPDMGNYVTQERTMVAFFLETLNKTGEFSLPEKIVFAVVPTAHFRLVSPRGKKEALDAYVEGLSMQRKANKLKKDSGSRREVSRLKENARRLIKEASDGLNIDFSGRLSLHFSQHDLKSQEDLYIHSLLIDMNIQEAKAIFEQLSAIAGRTKDDSNS